MSKAKHTAFVNGLKLMLQEDSSASGSTIAGLFDEDDCVCNDDIMKRLQKMFDELFGPIDDN